MCLTECTGVAGIFPEITPPGKLPGTSLTSSSVKANLNPSIKAMFYEDVDSAYQVLGLKENASTFENLETKREDVASSFLATIRVLASFKKGSCINSSCHGLSPQVQWVACASVCHILLELGSSSSIDCKHRNNRLPTDHRGTKPSDSNCHPMGGVGTPSLACCILKVVATGFSITTSVYFHELPEAVVR